MTILIVDDNARMRALVRSAVGPVTSERDSIHECDDGQRAILLYDELRPDWVLMDIMLPSVDGLEATRRILEHDSSARVIIVTQYDEPSYREAAKQAGAMEFVLKENLVEIAGLMLDNNA